MCVLGRCQAQDVTGQICLCLGGAKGVKGKIYLCLGSARPKESRGRFVCVLEVPGPVCHEADLFVFEKCQAEANSFVFGRRNAQFATRQICLCLGIARPRESRGRCIYV